MSCRRISWTGRRTVADAGSGLHVTHWCSTEHRRLRQSLDPQPRPRTVGLLPAAGCHGHGQFRLRQSPTDRVVAPIRASRHRGPARPDDQARSPRACLLEPQATPILDLEGRERGRERAILCPAGLTRQTVSDISSARSRCNRAHPSAARPLNRRSSPRR